MEAALDTLETVSPEEAQYLFERLLSRIEERNPGVDSSRVGRAYDYALRAHYGQFRDLGAPFIIHPVEVAEICADLNMDEDALIAALLHDVHEDTNYSLRDIESSFGRSVREMVDSLTKISDQSFFARLWNSRRDTGTKRKKEEEDTLRKLFVATARDPRVIVIKLADRLHSLRTLEGLKEERILRKCRETRDFYIPLARRLGLEALYSEMEDWCFRFLEPEEFFKLREEIKNPMAVAGLVLSAMQKDLEEAFRISGIPIWEIESRRKHLASIHRKMTEKNVALDEVYDLLAIRVVVDGDPLLCYQVLGEVHLRYKPVPERLRDLVGNPKPNGYRTLHTTVNGPGGRFVEVQIRNVEMHRQARYGIASHWVYKEGEPGGGYSEDEEWSELIRLIEEESLDSQEFIARAQAALLKDVVLTITPKGEVVTLPKGSCPVDFAYAIHTELGQATGGAKVNGKRVPLYCELKNGDLVEIIKRETDDPAPNPEWMEWVKSPRTYLKIRKWFRAQPRKKRIEVGKKLLAKQIQRRGLYPMNLLAADKLVAILKLLSVGSIYDIYDKIACGEFSTTEVIEKLRVVQMERVLKSEAPGGVLTTDLTPPLVASATELGVLNSDGKRTRRKTELAACCRPIHGDPIGGYYDRDRRRFIIHLVECGNPEFMRGMDGKRAEPVTWDPSSEGARYPVEIEVVVLNRAGLVYEIFGIFADRRINLAGAHFGTDPSSVGNPDQPVNTRFVIEVKNLEELNLVLDDIRGVADILLAKRVSGIESVGEDEAEDSPKEKREAEPAVEKKE